MQEFDCALVHRSRGLAVVRFVLTKGGSAFNTPVAIPPGSVSDGYFWTSRPYSLYRMRSPDGEVLAHRLDAVLGVTIEPNAVAFRDLVLDWWVLPGGGLIEEDRDELEDLAGRGVVGPRELGVADRATREVLGRYRHIIDGLERLERRVGAERVDLR